MVKVVVIIQARMSSSRLPGKVLMPILGRPILSIMTDRLRGSSYQPEIVVATSTEPSDDPIEKWGEASGVRVFRGSLQDVLDRFWQAVQTTDAEVIVRATADCPLVDKELLDQLLDFFFESDCDYASNCLEPTLPDGLDLEVFTRRALQLAAAESSLKSEREHVTPFMYKNRDRFRVKTLKHPDDLSRYRLTVDNPVDLEVVDQVIRFFGNANFSSTTLLKQLSSLVPILALNMSNKRNEGYLLSLLEDTRKT